MGRTKRIPDSDISEQMMEPPRSAAERENRCISYAYDLAEKKLRDGTASSQLITQFIRYGTERERNEREKLKRENMLLEARTDEIRSAERIEALYSNAIDAMRSYGGYEE